MEEHQTYVKKDAVRYISERLAIHKEDVCLVIDKLMEFLEQVAKGRHRFKIVNYLSVDCKTKPPKTINWSLNGKKDKIQVPEHCIIYVKPGRILRELADPEFFNRSNFDYRYDKDKDEDEEEEEQE